MMSSSSSKNRWEFEQLKKQEIQFEEQKLQYLQYPYLLSCHAFTPSTIMSNRQSQHTAPHTRTVAVPHTNTNTNTNTTHTHTGYFAHVRNVSAGIL